MNNTSIYQDYYALESLQSRILILEKDGNTFKPIRIHYDSQGRKWIEARPGTEYVLEIKNNLYEKILSVVSVDGLNVITGEEAKCQNKDGYVISPRDSLKIPGWRVSQDSVRKFVFSDRRDSYAEKLGSNSQNIGVIGFSFFREDTYHLTYTYWYPSWTSSWGSLWGGSGTGWSTTTCGKVPSMSGGYSFLNNVTLTSIQTEDNSESLITQSFQVGTGMGEREDHQVVDVDYHFLENPYLVDAIYYDSRENLIRNGILKVDQKFSLPQPFSNRFCKEV